MLAGDDGRGGDGGGCWGRRGLGDGCVDVSGMTCWPTRQTMTDFASLFRLLAQHDIEFILVGGAAATRARSSSIHNHRTHQPFAGRVDTNRIRK